MNRDEIPSERQRDWPVDIHAAIDLLQAGHYPKVLEILQIAIEFNQDSGDFLLAQTLNLAQSVCMECIRYQTEIGWHLKGFEETRQREKELLQQLLPLMDPAKRITPSQIHQEEETLSRPLSKTAALTISEKRPGLIQRISQIFRRSPEASLDVNSVQSTATQITFPEETPSTPDTPGNNLSECAPTIPAEILGALHPAGEEERESTLFVMNEEPTKDETPSLTVYCLGPFRVYQDEQPVENWPSGKGKAVFKYLVTHRDRPVIKDVLMELFWPDTPAESARNNLNVAVYGLRQALRKTRPFYSHVLFTDDCYLLNPDIHVWLDYEAFLQYISDARKNEENEDIQAGISEYCKAEALYQGEFLEEDRYEDWLVPQREQLQETYLSLLDRLKSCYFEKQDYPACITICRKILTVDPCREEAHRHLMQCYFERGQPYMALRQYHQCVEALKEELKVSPSASIKELYEYIRRNSLS